MVSGKAVPEYDPTQGLHLLYSHGHRITPHGLADQHHPQDCWAVFVTAGGMCSDSRMVDMARGQSGISARYQKQD